MNDESSDHISPSTREILRAHFDVNSFGANWLKSLKSELSHPQSRAHAAAFRNDLARAITHHTISPALYEELTGEDFDTPDELEDWLREIWQNLYGDAPIEET